MPRKLPNTPYPKLVTIDADSAVPPLGAEIRRLQTLAAAASFFD
jgi:hypothetical protein